MFIDRKNNLPIKLDIVKFKSVLSAWSEKLSVKGVNTIYLGNHDQTRSLSRFGNDKLYPNESGKMLATLLFTQANIPFFPTGRRIGYEKYRLQKSG
ncbi:MAG: alpha-amylase family glycosyl hydrolase [Bacteroidota bacterium]